MVATNFTIPQDQCALETCSMEQATIRYLPSLAGNITYMAIFGVILLLQIGLGIRYRTWGFMTGMICGLFLEIVGYAGRVMMHYNPFNMNNFLIYLVSLTIGPAFLSASIYLCLGRIITVHSVALSRLSPKAYTITFITCDFISLVLQAVGGAIASIADPTDKATRDLGVHIMVAGLAFQVFSLALFMALWGEFIVRIWRCEEADKNVAFNRLRASFVFKAFQISLFTATVLIFVRSVYRVAELESGFGGELANDQTLFMVFEGPMIMVATAVLTVFHPGRSFMRRWAEANWSFKKNGDAAPQHAKEMRSEYGMNSGKGIGAMYRVDFI